MLVRSLKCLWLRSSSGMVGLKSNNEAEELYSCFLVLTPQYPLGAPFSFPRTCSSIQCWSPPNTVTLPHGSVQHLRVAPLDDASLVLGHHCPEFDSAGPSPRCPSRFSSAAGSTLPAIWHLARPQASCRSGHSSRLLAGITSQVASRSMLPTLSVHSDPLQVHHSFVLDRSSPLYHSHHREVREGYKIPYVLQLQLSVRHAVGAHTSICTGSGTVINIGCAPSQCAHTPTVPTAYLLYTVLAAVGPTISQLSTPRVVGQGPGSRWQGSYFK